MNQELAAPKVATAGRPALPVGGITYLYASTGNKVPGTGWCCKTFSIFKSGPAASKTATRPLRRPSDRTRYHCRAWEPCRPHLRVCQAALEAFSFVVQQPLRTRAKAARPQSHRFGFWIIKICTKAPFQVCRALCKMSWSEFPCSVCREDMAESSSEDEAASSEGDHADFMDDSNSSRKAQRIYLRQQKGSQASSISQASSSSQAMEIQPAALQARKLQRSHTQPRPAPAGSQPLSLDPVTHQGNSASSSLVKGRPQQQAAFGIGQQGTQHMGDKLADGMPQQQAASEAGHARQQGHQQQVGQSMQGTMQPTQQGSAQSSQQMSQQAETQQQALSGDQLAVLYTSCLKLASENKIDKHNTWQLGLIDHLVTLLAPANSIPNPHFTPMPSWMVSTHGPYACTMQEIHSDACSAFYWDLHASSLACTAQANASRTTQTPHSGLKAAAASALWWVCLK